MSTNAALPLITRNRSEHVSNANVTNHDNDGEANEITNTRNISTRRLFVSSRVCDRLCSGYVRRADAMSNFIEFDEHEIVTLLDLVYKEHATLMIRFKKGGDTSPVLDLDKDELNVLNSIHNKLREAS